MNLSQTQVSQLYVTLFGRASEGRGNTYWQSFLPDMVATATAMLNTSVAIDYFGTTLDSNQSFIESIYLKALGKTYAEDKAGIDYWVAELASGKSKGEVVTALIQAAVSPENAGTAQDLFVNRVSVSDYTASTIETFTNLSVFENFIANVTNDEATVTTAKATVDTVATTLTGIVSDGLIKGATVFADANGDGVWNVGEAKTITDAEGNFTLKGGEGAIVATGGTDISTKLPFEGTFTAPAGSAVVTPLTTLIDQVMEQQKITADEAASLVAKALGITSGTNLLTFDCIAVAADANATAAEKKAAIEIQTASVQVASMLDQAAAMLDGAGVATEQTGAVFAASALASMIVETALSGTLDLDLASSDTVKSFLTATATRTAATEEQTAAIEKVAADIATATANVNDTVAKAEKTAGSGASAADVFTQLAKIQVAAEAIEDLTESGTKSGDASAAGENSDPDTFGKAVEGAVVPKPTPSTDDTNSGGGSSGNGGGGVTPPVAKFTVTNSSATLAEDAANDGSITATLTFTLSGGETFTGANTDVLGTVTNTPDGLTAVLVRASDTTATLSFTGKATAHANAQDISNLTVTFANSDFTGGNASIVTGATTNNLVLDFTDPPAITYSATTFTEAAANDGSITATSTITLVNDTFTGVNGDVLGTVTNTPAGLTAVLVRASDTTATLSFTGTATAHANAQDINNLTVAFANGDFTGGDASIVAGATNNTLVVDFADPPVLTYSATTFTEAAANDGSITATSTITLVNDTFTGVNGDALGRVTNTPDGMTAVLVRASDTTATLSFTGKATAHVNAQDVSNLTVTFANSDFTGGNASIVTGATTNNLVVDFADPPAITYSATTFTEAAANDGSITATSTITLVNDTFTGVNGDVLGAVTNTPVGLTAVLVRASDTTATLSFTGKATAHANAQDISNLTVAFANSDFTGGNASIVTGATTNTLGVDFTDPTFIVTNNAGVVTFGGTATGDITISWAGAVATFTRATIDAATTVDFSAVPTKITVGSGQTLAATAANVTGEVIDGAGTVAITGLGTAAADLSKITSSVKTVAFPTTGSLDPTTDIADFDVTVAAGQTMTALAAQVTGLTVNGPGSLSVNASADADLTLAGSANVEVTNLTSTLNATHVSGSLNVTTAADTMVSIITGSGTNTINGDAQQDGQRIEIAGPGAATVTLTEGNLVAFDTGGLTVKATTGTNDILTFGSGNDIIDGGAGVDFIDSGAGQDRITGGVGADLLSGGTGDTVTDIFVQAAGDSADMGANVNTGSGVFADTDTIVTTNADIISNFEVGFDLIALTAAVVEATQDVTAADGGVGVGEFTAIRGQNSSGTFTVNSSGDDKLVLYDADGFGDIEMVVLGGAGAANITADNFTLINPALSVANALTAYTANNSATYTISDTLEKVAASAAGAHVVAAQSIATTGDASMTAAVATRLAGYTLTNTGGRVTLSDGGTVTGIATVGAYILAVAGNDFTLGNAVQDVNVTGGVNTINVAGLTVTGAITGMNNDDILKMASGADISSATGINAAVNGYIEGSVTMTAAQHGHLATGGITAGGDADQITLTDTFIGTGDAAIETYDLDAGDNSFSLGSATQNVMVLRDQNNIDVAGLTFTGEISGVDIGETLIMTDGADISSAKGIRVAIKGNITGSVSMTAAQHGNLATGGITADGDVDQITLTTSITGIGDAAIETYVLANAFNGFSLGDAAQNVTVTGGENIIGVADLTVTGALTGMDRDDTLTMTNGADISSATGINAAVRGHIEGSVTMTAAQHDHLATGGIMSTGRDNITITDAFTGTGDANINAYLLADAVNDFTFAAAANLQGVMTTGTGLDTIKSVLADGGNVGTAVWLGEDTTADIIQITNTSLSCTDKSYTRVKGFTAASDTIKAINTATGALTGGTGFQTITKGSNTVVGVRDGSVIVITGETQANLTLLTEGDVIETAIAAAIGTIDSGEYLIALADNSNNIGLYDYATTANGNDQTTGTMEIELIGILDDIADGALSDFNFV